MNLWDFWFEVFMTSASTYVIKSNSSCLMCYELTVSFNWATHMVVTSIKLWRLLPKVKIAIIEIIKIASIKIAYHGIEWRFLIDQLDVFVLQQWIERSQIDVQTSPDRSYLADVVLSNASHVAKMPTIMHECCTSKHKSHCRIHLSCVNRLFWK